MNRPELRLATISDYLGPAETRFFGSGYRRADYRFAEAELRPEGLQSSVTIEYPRDWSRKGINDLRPHLSTIDALVLAARMADALLAGERGLGPHERSHASIVRATIQAGTAPQENLEDLPVTARIDEAEPRDGEITTVRCSVGQMRVQLRVSHRAPEPSPVGSVAALGGYWGDGFREDTQELTDVVANLDTLECSGSLTVHHGPQPATQGLEDAAHHPVSLIDAFVSHVQLSQIVLYEMDGLARHESNTLWMQQTTLERDRGVAVAPAAHAIAVKVTRTDLLRLGAARWRDITFNGQVAGVRQRSVFAHRLPEHVLARVV